MLMTNRLWRCCVLGFMLAGCSSSPEPQLASADDVLQLKLQGDDDSALLTWVKDPARTFSLLEPDFERLARAGVGEIVLGELRVRTEEYRRSRRSKTKHVEKSKHSSGDGHNH